MGPVYPQIRTSADILKSTIRIEQLIPFLKEQKAEVGALVNSKLYGLLPFVTAMKKANIHPVIGLMIEVEFEGAYKLPVILYAKSNEGYQNLLKVSSAASITQHEVIPMRWLQSYSKGLIAVIPTNADQFSWLESYALPFLELVKTIFGEQLYIGLERKPNSSNEMEHQVIMLSEHLNCQIVALHENLYMQEEDYFAYEVATAIDRGVKLNETVQTVQLNKKKDHYLLTEDQWNRLYEDAPHYLQATRDMLLSCQVDLDVSIVHMPKYPLNEGETAELRLKKHVHLGLMERLGENIPTAYIERAKYELNIINTMGYADYFLIVEDFMRYARAQNILTGPGRGSSASSLVAYALQITQVDPLAYDLLFERFLNPERVSLPDIDIDFLDTRRDEVIAYVAQKYGKKHVAQIITFGTLSAKAVGRDVARMFNFDSETLEMISKLIPNKIGITLTEAYNSSDKLREWVEAAEIRKRWYHTALKLEGLPRNASTHAAGVVLSPVPLVDVVPIQEGHDGIYLTQWPMQEVEQSGLLKMDFLGLRNLTILDLICKSIAGSHQVKIDLNRLPLNDAKTFELLRQGDTTGIFQLESDGMRQALREIKPTQFSDIVAVNALYRPGPMDFIPVYARRKHHQEPVIMPHEHLAPILDETYGIIVYQEQIMRIANVMAGFSIGEADLLRRAVSKKKREVLEEQREKFVHGSQKKGYDVHVANAVYELIVRFADYGFAKSHAVAYSLISYQLAYLKANFPVNFYAALMTNASGNQDKLVNILHEAKSKQIEILPPSIYKSGRYFKVEQNKIRFSLSAIKGVPQPVLKQLGSLNSDEIHSIFDLAVAMKGNTFSRKNMEPLIKAGALDDFQKDRATLLATLDAAVKQAELVTQFTDEDDLFGNNPYAFGRPKHIEASPIPLKEKLMFEKEVLGFYLSDHPIQLIRHQFHMHTSTSAALSTIQDGTFIAVIGQVEEARVIRTKKGEQMAFVTLTDEFGQIAITLFPKVFTVVKSFIQEEAIVFVEGKLERRYGKIQIIVNSLKGL